MSKVNAIELGEMWFNLSSDQTYYIVGCGAPGYGGGYTDVDLIIPSEYNGKPVKEIDSYGFINFARELVSVYIPSTIEKIGIDFITECEKLTSIVVDPGNNFYKSDGNCLIEKSTNILIKGCNTSIIPQYVTEIKTSAFRDCGIKTITIPNSVKTVGDSVFAGCKQLISAKLSNQITSIGEYMFWYCENLMSIEIPDSVTHIGSWAFYGCEKLTTISIPNSLLSIGPNSLNSCQNLTNIILKCMPETVSKYSFSGCPNLEKIYVIDGTGWAEGDIVITTDGNKPISILPAEPAVIAKTMSVKSMKIS